MRLESSRLAKIWLSVALVCRVVDGQSFSDNFNRSRWPGLATAVRLGAIPREFSRAANAEPLTTQYSGRCCQALAITFPLTFSLDFRTVNVPARLPPTLPYNDGDGSSPSIAQSAAENAPAQSSFTETLARESQSPNNGGTSDVQRTRLNPIPGWQNFGAVPAHIGGTINADLSARITISTQAVRPSRCLRCCLWQRMAPLLLLGNSNRSSGPHSSTNLQIGHWLPGGCHFFSGFPKPQSMAATFKAPMNACRLR